MLERAAPVSLVIALLVAGCGQDESRRLTPAERAQLTELRREIAEGLEAASAQRLVTLRDASARIRPAGGAPPCPRTLPAADADELRVRHSLLEVEQLAPGYDVRDDPHQRLADPGEPSLHIHGVARRVAYRGRRAQILENVRSSIQYRLDEGEWSDPGGREAAMAGYEAWRERLDWELVILVEAYREPRHDGTSFIDGIVRGRAFLYDHAEDEVVCVAPVDAHSSESVSVRYDPSRDGLRGNQALLDDLHGRALAVALEGLRAVTAPAEAPPL